MKPLWILCLGLSVWSVGCDSSPPAADLEHPHGTWTALQDFQVNGMMMVGPAADQGNWRAVRGAVGSDQFQKAVEAFVASPLPEELKDQQSLKTEVDDSLKGLVAAAKTGGKPDEMKSQFTAYQDAIRKLKDQIEHPSE